MPRATTQRCWRSRSRATVPMSARWRPAQGIDRLRSLRCGHAARDVGIGGGRTGRRRHAPCRRHRHLRVRGDGGPRSGARGDRGGKDDRARQQGSAGHGGRARDRRLRAGAAWRSCRSTASTTPFTSACMGGRASEVRRLILTASGGPFRDYQRTRSNASDRKRRCSIRPGRWGGRSQSTLQR